MSDDRHISDADARAIADAAANLTPEGRRDAARRSINEMIHGQHSQRREGNASKLAHVLGWDDA